MQILIMQFHMHYMQNTNYVGNRAYMISSTGLSLTHCHVIKNANTTLIKVHEKLSRTRRSRGLRRRWPTPVVTPC
jgi:hypothetical protein